ncbi:MAG: flavodoxin domain-containing protein [bacterium]
MRALIIYKSKYGTAKQYAEWIKEEVEADIFSIDDFNISEIQAYDKIIIVSATYMGVIKADKFLIENWNLLKDKKVYLVAVGLVFTEDAVKTYEQIPAFIRKNIQYIKIPGKIQYNRLNLFEKIMVKIMKGQNLDKVDRNTIKPVVEFANEK